MKNVSSDYLAMLHQLPHNISLNAITGLLCTMNKKGLFLSLLVICQL